jgi:hypothetical protein
VTTGADPYTHISKIDHDGATAGSDLPTGLSLEIGFADVNQYYVHDGCKIATLGFSATSEGVCIVDVGIIGQGVAQSTSPADASPTEYTSSALDHFAATMKEGGSTISIVTDVNLTLDNLLDQGQYVVGGSGELAGLPTGIASVNGSLTALFEDDTLLTKGRAHTETSLQLVWTDATHSLTLDVAEMIYEPAGPQINGPAGVVQTLNFRAYYGDHADAGALKSTLVNSVVSY